MGKKLLLKLNMIIKFSIWIYLIKIYIIKKIKQYNKLLFIEKLNQIFYEQFLISNNNDFDSHTIKFFLFNKHSSKNILTNLSKIIINYYINT